MRRTQTDSKDYLAGTFAICLYPVGHFGFTPVTFFKTLPLRQLKTISLACELAIGLGDDVGFGVFCRVMRDLRVSSSDLRTVRLLKSTSPTIVSRGTNGSCKAFALVGSM